MPDSPVVRNYDKKTHKKCIKCRQWKPKEDVIDPETGEILQKHGFGSHADNYDGLQVQCLACKGSQDSKRRMQNVNARLRHHIATRCTTQLGQENLPPRFTAQLEDHLGYRIPALVKHLREQLKEREGPDRKLRDALDEGYHVDHIRPLMSFDVVTPAGIDWAAFQECWAIENLVAIPAEENLAKGAKWDGEVEKDR